MTPPPSGPAPLRLPPVRKIAYVPPAKRKGLKVKTRDEGNARSLWEQISDTFTSIPGGVVKLGADAARTFTFPARLAVDLARGDVTMADLGQTAGVMPWELDDPGNEEAARVYDRIAPLQRQVVQSMGSTALDIRHPSRFGEAVREGRIVDKLLEDVGNAALVGAPLAKGLTAAGMPRAGLMVRRAARLGGAASDLPVSLPRMGLRAAGRGIVKGVERLGEYDRFGPAVRGLKARAPMLLTEEGRLARRQARQTVRLAGRRRTAVRRAMGRAVTETGADLVDQGVATALRTGIGDIYKRTVDQGIAPDVAREMIVKQDLPEQTMTPEVADATIAYLDGSMPAEQRARIDEYASRVDEVIGAQTERALAGAGRVGGQMDPAYLGNDAIPDAVERAVKDAGYDMNTVPPAVLDAILDSPDVYPAQWRPAMRAALMANDAGGLGLPVRPPEMVAAGMTPPKYLPGGRSELVEPHRIGTGREPLNEGLRGWRGLGSEKFRATGERQPFSARTVAEKAGDEAYVTTMNEGIQSLANDPSIGTVGSHLDPGEIARMRADAAAEALAQRGTPEQIAAREAQFFGEKVLDALRERGYEVLPGNRLDPQVGDFDPASSVDPALISEDSVILPTGLKAKLVPYMIGRDLSPVMRLLERFNTKFKGAVLPFSLRWQIGDAVGGLFMGTVGGAVPPWEMIQRMRQVRKNGLANLDPGVVDNVIHNPQLADASLNFEEMRWYLDGSDAKKPRTPIGRVQRRSFKINAGLNRINRHSYVLAKLQRVLDQRGLGKLEDVSAGPGWADPDVQAAVAEAVDDANRVMGTFDEMTPFERRVMRNVFPFWAWARHITQLAWNTAVDHPARMMWTMRLGSLAADPDSDLLPWLEGSLRVGDSLIGTNYANPFNDVGTGSMFVSPRGAARSISPGLKIAAAGLFGVDANKGFDAVTRPGGTADPGARPLLFTDPAGLAYYGVKQFPQARVAMNLAPTSEPFGIGLGPHPRFGQGSLMVDKKGRPIDTDSRWGALAPLIGLPVPESAREAETIAAKQAERERITQLRLAKVPRYRD